MRKNEIVYDGTPFLIGLFDIIGLSGFQLEKHIEFVFVQLPSTNRKLLTGTLTEKINQVNRDKFAFEYLELLIISFAKFDSSRFLIEKRRKHKRKKAMI